MKSYELGAENKQDLTMKGFVTDGVILWRCSSEVLFIHEVSVPFEKHLEL